MDPTPYDLICLTSANGVERLFERLAAGGRDARSLARIRIAAIGAGTARSLAKHGITADVVPERFVAESLIEALSDFEVKHALVATASGAREVLPDALRARGAQVDVLALYKTVAEPLSERTLRQAQTADYITFTSSSSVRYFLDALRARGGHRAFDGHPNQLLRNDEIAAEPGQAHTVASHAHRLDRPVTSATLRERGLEPHVEAERQDIDGLVEALLADTDVIPCRMPRQASLGHPRIHLRRTDSTNERARQLAIAGAPHGTTVTAEEQSAGRGRQGRSWLAPPGSALLCSLVLRDPSPLLSLIAGVAVCDVVGDDARVKWPNDVVIERPPERSGNRARAGRRARRSPPSPSSPASSSRDALRRAGLCLGSA